MFDMSYHLRPEPRSQIDNPCYQVLENTLIHTVTVGSLFKKILQSNEILTPLIRVSTNLTEQISSRFQEGFREKSRTHCIASACYVNLQYRIYFCDIVWLNTEQKHDMHLIHYGAISKIK